MAPETRVPPALIATLNGSGLCASTAKVISVRIPSDTAYLRPSGTRSVTAYCLISKAEPDATPPVSTSSRPLSRMTAPTVYPPAAISLAL